MNPDLLLWLAVAGMVLTCIAAIGARSLAEFAPHELKEICRRRKSSDRLGLILRHRDQVALAAETLQVIATAVVVGAWVLWFVAKSPTEGTANMALLISSVAGAAVVLLAVEIWIPWAVVRLWAAPFLYHTWPAWRAVGVLLTPLVMAARFVDAVMHRLAGRVPEIPDEESFEDDIRTIVSEGHREGLLEEDAREMIEGVIELSDVHVSEIMTPRTDMVSMPMALTWKEALQFVTKVSLTRIPVSNKNRDDIVGILHIKDLLPELAKEAGETQSPWTSLLRDPFYVPETKPIDVLLQEFQRTRNHMAVVLDEYGGVSGLVTMEDVLEEIVGEIVDEYDKDLVDGIRELDDGLCEALGKIHIDEINERLDLQLPDDGDFDTIGGFVFSELGHVPIVGEELVRNNVRITVVEATRRRIERVRLEILDRNLPGQEPS
ncbi:MAG TPA: hemolysin family protein [Thermoguttaceae bacterium]|nr:hemolysin family protein [Thermoguttaceae bacterium]